VEILRGGRSKALLRNSYDGLPDYGAFAHLPSADVLERVDALLAAGRLRSSGGPYPVLSPSRAGAPPAEAANPAVAPPPAARASDGQEEPLADAAALPADERAAPLAAARDLAELEDAIVELVTTAPTPIGRTRTVEILRGSRASALRRSGHDRLDAYGAFAHLSSGDVLAEVDELVSSGRLRLTGGAYPTLRVTAAAPA
jgi:hypothetical protein